MNEQVSGSHFLIGLLIYTLVGFIMYYIVEPYLRLRKGIIFGGEDKTDQQFNRLFCSLLWPIWIPGYPLWVTVIMPFCRSLVKLHHKAETFWEPKIPEMIEPTINEAKSDYRKVIFHRS